jgi:hypothetical protein
MHNEYADTSKLYKGKALQKLVAKLGKEEDESSMAHERFPLVPPPQVRMCVCVCVCVCVLCVCERESV